MNVQTNVASKSVFSLLSLLDCSFETVNFVAEFIVLLFKIMVISAYAILRKLIPQSKKDLKDEIVLITGSAHGVGRQLAIKIAELGAKVVLWDINKAQLQEVKDEIISRGGQASSYVCDVTSESEVNTTAQMVAKEVGDVTILINNAGILQNVPILELDSAKIRRTFEVNTISHFWTIRAFLPKMQENNYGHIVAISSGAGLLAHINQSDYSASKFAVIGLMGSLFEELRQRNSNVRLTTICPVTINTGLNHHPVSRYPWMLPVLSIENAAEKVLNAIRKEEYFVTIPRRLQFWVNFAKLFPPEVISEVMDTLEYCRISNAVPVPSEEKK